MTEASWFLIGFCTALLGDIIAGLISGWRSVRRRRRLEHNFMEQTENCTTVVQFTSQIPECITREGIVINEN